jgi:hypothetical protein
MVRKRKSKSPNRCFSGGSKTHLPLRKKMNKEKHKTYQAAPKTETPTESAMPIAENTKGDM